MILSLILLAATSVPPASAAPQADPAAADALRETVREQLQIGSYRTVLNAYERLQALPGLPDARRAEALREGARVRARLGDLSGAERDFALALKLAPQDAEAAYGLALAMRDRPERALPYADQAARGAAGRRRADALRLAGEIRMELGDAAGARADLDQALARAPDDLYALQDMARLLRDRPKDAAAFAWRAVDAAEATPAWARADAFLQCARVWLEFQDRAGAEFSLRRALAVDPDHLDAWEALAQLKRDRAAAGDSPGAAPAQGRAPKGSARSAAVSDPAGLESLRRRIARSRDAKRPSEALALADRFMDAVEEAPAWEQAAAYHLLARALRELGSEDWARHAYFTARDLDTRSLATAEMGLELEDPGPTTMDALAGLVRARAEIAGIGDGGLDDFAPPSAYGAADFVALCEAAESILVGGRATEAMSYAERLVEVSAKSPAASRAAADRLRGMVRHELNDDQGAKDDFRRAAAAAPALGAESGLGLAALDRSERASLDAGRRRAAAGDDLSALQDRARLLRERPQDAAVFARRAVAAAETMPAWARADAFVQCARIWLEFEDRAGAEASLRRALAEDPDQLEALETLARLKGDGAGRKAAARKGAASDPAGLESLRRLIARSRDEKNLPVALALAHRITDAVKEAPAWERAAAYHLFTRVWRELGSEAWARRTHLAGRDLDPRSLRTAEMGLELDLHGPTTLDALRSVVHARAEMMGVDEGRRRDFPPPQDFGSSDAAALRAAAESILVDGRAAEALPYAERLVEVSAKSPGASRAAADRLRGMIRHELNDDAGAGADFRRADAEAPAL